MRWEANNAMCIGQLADNKWLHYVNDRRSTRIDYTLDACNSQGLWILTILAKFSTGELSSTGRNWMCLCGWLAPLALPPKFLNQWPSSYEIDGTYSCRKPCSFLQHVAQLTKLDSFARGKLQWNVLFACKFKTYKQVWGWKRSGLRTVLLNDDEPYV